VERHDLRASLGWAARILKERGPLFFARRVIRKLGDVTGLGPARSNSIDSNLEAWSYYDWSSRGEEWNPSPDFKDSLVAHVLEPNVPMGSRVLEIGPGGGRWTEVLLGRASHVTAVDLTPRCIELCRERFPDARNLDLFVNDGRDLSFVADASIDRIFSFDVFVHILAKDIEGYVAQFPRILKEGGRAVIHHARAGALRSGWRSDMTAEHMRIFCDRHGLKLVEQIRSWDQGRMGLWERDVISVIAR
jgi:SAM-dependent methyltransferase